jgi:predicted RNA-binding Zn-ribbon protein involved in translation (DUF1610 family)
MTVMENNMSKSLKALAELMGIIPFHGWQKELAARLGVKSDNISTWIRRARIPKPQIKRIENLGYPLEKWIVKDSVSLRDLQQARLLSGAPIEPKNLRHVENLLEILEGTDKALAKLTIMGLKYLNGLKIDRKIMRAVTPKTENRYTDFPCPKCGSNRVLVLMRETDPADYRCRDCGHTFRPEKKTQNG